jgi:hypothetical protein
MRQFYFLSIVTNLLAGFVLVADRLERYPFVLSIRNSIERPGFRLGLGLAAFVVGFFKLLTVTYGDVAVVGDLVPAFSGLALGWTLLVEYYKGRTSVPSDTLDAMDRIFVGNRFVFGIAGIASAVLHFFFPAVLLL